MNLCTKTFSSSVKYEVRRYQLVYQVSGSSATKAVSELAGAKHVPNASINHILANLIVGLA
jgi:hypothetical protein